MAPPRIWQIRLVVAVRFVARVLAWTVHSAELVFSFMSSEKKCVGKESKFTPLGRERDKPSTENPVQRVPSFTTD